MPEPVTQSRAKQLAIAVASVLEGYTPEGAIVRPLWHPTFASKSELKETNVTVRPASRSFKSDGKFTGSREVDIQIGVVKALPPNSSSTSDPYNDNDTLDALDLLSETIFDLYCRVDEEDQEDEATAGQLATVPVCGFLPFSVDQPTLLNNSLLESDRLFLSVVTVRFQRLE